MCRSSRFSIVVGLVVIMTAPPARAVSPLTSVSADPYTNPLSQHMTEVEPHAFAVGNTVIAAFQVGRFYEAGGSGIGWARSTDGGSTWADGFLPSLTADQDGGPYASASDPVVGYDAKHSTWLISSLGNYGSPSPGHFLGSDVVVSGSTDGGATWGGPVVVGFGGTPTILDKPWVACDNTVSSPHYGSCYLTWDDYDAGDVVYMSASTDGGVTWSAPVRPAGGANGLGGVPVVTPSGRVVVPFLAGSDAIGVFSSGDGGATWGRVRIAAGVRSSGGGSIRRAPLPAVAIDAKGVVYVAWGDCRFAAGCSRDDVVFIRSRDGGRTWSRIRRLPADLKRGDHWGIGLGIDPETGGKHAHVAVSYYVNRSDPCVGTCEIDLRFASSVDGGAHWSGAAQLAGPMQSSWAPATGAGRMFGDYFGMAFASDGSAVPAVSVALTPGVGFAQSIWSGRLAVTGGSKPAQAPAARVTVQRHSVAFGLPRR